ncbi:hypothetical protein ASF61_06395 [Duganella sp. Leaf126]|uniref:P-loop NTPase fold protein n=1 Tax=Duganella sp. Leaf126 TaxID=1736266 RepID=UPI0006F4A521|nr:P-loop NTPase fold protein [Duganella sp. Leaf126]KQQ40386.1 hypothetical protein ASF61_06395 [Duganella sp. Leaf126]
MQPAHDDAIEVYLTQYCTQPASPHYAVLIEGEWGAGKTWRIKQFAQRLTEQHQKKTLYVSLYGVSSINDIAEQFFRQLNPLLGSTVVQTSWGLARSALKGTFKIADDALELEMSAPDIQKRLRTHNAVLIFDDLERSTMPVDDVLGIINQLVEHDDHRVLILANPDQVPERGTTIPFATLKEKVIGRTLRLSPDPRGALQSFLNELGEVAGSQQLAKHQETVLRVFELAGYSNLRQLRQAMLDFSRVRGALQQAVPYLQLPEPYVRRLVHEVLALSIEFRAGQLELDDLSTLCDSAATLPSVDSERARGAGAARLRLHGLDDITAYGLPPALYREYFQYGELRHEALREAIRHSAWFVTEDEPAWLQLWHWQQLSNARFNALVYKLQEAYMDSAFDSPGAFLHATGLLLQFIGMRLLQMPDDAVQDLGSEVVKAKWATSGTLHTALTAEDRAAIDGNGAFGLAYWSRSHPIFRKLQSDLRTAVTATQQQQFKYWWELWMTELRTDPQRWASRIASSAGAQAQFGAIPFTEYLHADEFAKLLAGSDMPVLRTVLRALQTRYAGVSHPALAQEAAFWGALLPKLEYYAGNRDETEGVTLGAAYLTQQIIPFIAALPPRLEKLRKQR